jgi:hypothetical protein
MARRTPLVAFRVVGRPTRPQGARPTAPFGRAARRYERPTRKSGRSKRVGDRRVVKLLVAVHLSVTQLPDKHPAGMRRLARSSYLAAELANRHDRIALSDELLWREGGDVLANKTFPVPEYLE